MEFHSYSEYRKVAQKYDRNVRKISNHVALGKACYISLLDGAFVEGIVSEKEEVLGGPQGSRSKGLRQEERRLHSRHSTSGVSRELTGLTAVRIGRRGPPRSDTRENFSSTQF